MLHSVDNSSPMVIVLNQLILSTTPHHICFRFILIKFLIKRSPVSGFWTNRPMPHEKITADVWSPRFYWPFFKSTSVKFSSYRQTKKTALKTLWCAQKDEERWPRRAILQPLCSTLHQNTKAQCVKTPSRTITCHYAIRMKWRKLSSKKKSIKKVALPVHHSLLK